jgi:hypothetical protein
VSESRGLRSELLVPSKGDPPVPADGSCATCGKPRRVTKKQRKYCGDALLQDPFCRSSCARKWWGCELSGGRNYDEDDG